MSALWASLIAVFGTLGGGVLAGVMQGRLTRIERRDNRDEARRADALAAVTTLVATLADHRRAMWLLGDRRLSGADEDAVTEARQTTHVTRSAVTTPLVTVRILAPALGALATRATEATFAMRDPADAEVLQDRREAARRASDELVDAASEFFANLSVPR
jgi:hypothetical protein